MKKILIPTDLSSDSIKAYGVASSIAKNKGYSIHLFHVVKKQISDLAYLIYGLYGLEDDQDSLEVKIKEAYVSLEEHKKMDVFKGLKVTSNITPSIQSPASEVIKELNNTDYELIIVGSSNTYNNNRLSRIISRFTKRPLMIVKSDTTEFSMRNTMVTLDFSKDISSFMKKIKYFSGGNYQNIDFLYVNTPNNFKTTQEVLDEYNNMISKYNLVRTQLIIYSAKTLKDGVLENASKWNYDFIALATYGVDAWSYLFKGDDVEAIIERSNQSIFLMNLDAFEESVDKKNEMKMIEKRG